MKVYQVIRVDNVTDTIANDGMGYFSVDTFPLDICSSKEKALKVIKDYVLVMPNGTFTYEEQDPPITPPWDEEMGIVYERALTLETDIHEIQIGFYIVEKEVL